MAQETEIKLKIGDVRAFHRVLKRIGARPAGVGTGRVHEENVIFDTPEGGLAKHGQLLRIRTETPEVRAKAKSAQATQRIVVTFKQPLAQQGVSDFRRATHGRYKVRDEIEVEVSETANLTKIFEGLGMSGWFRYEKFRTTFRLPSSKAWARELLIELDETPIGTFGEIEGQPQWIDSTARRLSISVDQYLKESYSELFAAWKRKTRSKATEMTFKAVK